MMLLIISVGLLTATVVNRTMMVESMQREDVRLSKLRKQKEASDAKYQDALVQAKAQTAASIQSK